MATKDKRDDDGYISVRLSLSEEAHTPTTDIVVSTYLSDQQYSTYYDPRRYGVEFRPTRAGGNHSDMRVEMVGSYAMIHDTLERALSALRHVREQARNSEQTHHTLFRPAKRPDPIKERV